MIYIGTARAMNEEWELSKENVMPVKRGRSAFMLSNVLAEQKSSRHDKNIEEERQVHFDKQLDMAKGNALETLTVYENQYKWIRDHFPTDSSRLVKLLEQCTFDLKQEESCRNETRFIKMWIEYVSACKQKFNTCLRLY